MPTAYELAQKEVGTYEWAQGSNPKVLKYYADAGHPEVKDDAVAWCAAFVGAMLARAGIKPSGQLTARSYLNWGTPVPDLSQARPGDIVIFTRGNSGWQGHVAFYEGKTETHVKVLGGNQSDAVTRAKYPRDDLLGIRRPPAPAGRPPVASAPPAATPTAENASGLLAAVLRILAALFKPKGS